MSLFQRATTAVTGPVVAVALAVSLVSTGGSAEAAPKGSPAGLAGTWLSHQLKDGLVHNHQYGFDDYGLTADTVLALKAIGRHDTAVHQARRALAQHVADYTTYQQDVYAGPLAKLLVVAQRTGGGARDFGGVNLVRRVSHRVSTTAPIRGRLEDKSATDYANTVGQILAVRGLLAADNTSGKLALRFLLDQQCGAGFFRLDFNADKSAHQQGCTRTSPADTDVTAFAVLELWSLRETTGRLHSGLKDAVAWLQRHQSDRGSLGGGPTTAAANTNSTGLAAWAFEISGRCGAAADAAAWVEKHQVSGRLAGTPLEGERGAIAYDGAALKAARKHGITAKTRDQWRRSTAQAGPGLLHLSGCRKG